MPQHEGGRRLRACRLQSRGLWRSDGPLPRDQWSVVARRKAAGSGAAAERLSGAAQSCGLRLFGLVGDSGDRGLLGS